MPLLAPVIATTLFSIMPCSSRDKCRDCAE
jgi:hypothetical protein